MAIFDVGSHIVTEVTNGYLTGTSESLGTWGLNTFDDEIAAMNLGELIAATLEAILVNTAMSIMATLIMIVLYGRMMEIYMYISIAPIPFSTLLNKEWGMIGTNYIRTLCALAFQSFLLLFVSLCLMH